MGKYGPGQWPNDYMGYDPISGSEAVWVREAFPVYPDPGRYLPIRLTNGSVFYTAGGGISSSVATIDQGAPNTLAAAWPVKISDGTNVLGIPGFPFVVSGTVGLVPGASVAVTQATSPWTVTGSVGLTGPITGTVGLSGPITGTVSLASAPTVNQGTNPWLTQDVSGSVVGLLVGGNALNQANPVPVNVVAGGAGGGLAQLQVRNYGDGNWVNVIEDAESSSGSHVPTRIFGTSSFSVEPYNVDPPPTAWALPVRTVGGGSSVTVVSGSVTGLLVGGNPVNQSNPVPVTGTIGIASAVAVTQGTNPWVITGSVGLTAPITGNVGITGPITGTVSIASAVTVNQGTNPWTVTGSVGLTGPITGTVGIASVVTVNQGTNPWTVTGSVGLTGPITGTVGIASAVTVNQGTNPWTVTGSVGLTGPITGSVTLATAPTVNQGTNPWTITGSVGLTAPITGNVGITGPITGSVVLASAPTVVQGPGLGSGSAALAWPVQFEDNAGNLIKAADNTNNALRVNVVAGGAGGGLAQLQVRNYGDGNWVNVIEDAESSSGSHVPTRIFGTSSFSVEPYNVDPPTTAWALPVRTVGGGSNVTVVSGSITGLLVGGQPVNQANPVPVTGTVGIASAVAVTQGTNPWTVTGSVGLTSPITGNVGITGPITGTVSIASAVTVNQGTNPWTITGSVGLTAPITGSVVLASAPTVNQGTNPWTITGSVGLTGPITGTVAVASVVSVTSTLGNLAVEPSATYDFSAGNLAQNAIYTTPWFDSRISGQGISSYVRTDQQVSFFLEFSNDQTVSASFPSYAGVVAPFVVASGTTFFQTFAIPTRYARAKYQNTGAGTTNVIQLGTTQHFLGLQAPVTGVVSLASAPQVNQGTNPWVVTGSIGLISPITGNVGITGPITGTVAIASAVTVNQGTNPWTITGSVGLTAPITGSVTLASAPTVNQGTNPWVVTGSIGLIAPITGNVGITGPITGTVAIASAVTVNQGTNPWTITGSVGLTAPITGSVTLASAPQIASGSVTGLLVGGNALNQANPIPITGSVSLTVAPLDKIQSGSVTGLLVGGNALNLANPLPVTGTVSLASAPTVNQGTNPWVVTGSIGLIAPITGSVVLAAAPDVHVFGRAAVVNPTITTDGAQVQLMADVLGKLVVMPYALSASIVNGYLTSTGSVADILAAPGAGLKNYVTSIGGSNTSTTNVRADILDGATVKASFYLAASGGGFTLPMPVPMTSSFNSPIRILLGASVTDCRFTAQGYIAP